MNLSESISNTLRKLEKINLVEGSGHLEHPEDLVFLGDEQGAKEAIKQIENTIKSPNSITIKWDGYPALIFGRGKDGRFSVMDKHMFKQRRLIQYYKLSVAWTRKIRQRSWFLLGRPIV